MPATAKLKTAPEVTEGAQAGAGLRTFARIVERWDLPQSDAMALLGVESRLTYYELLKRARATKEVKGLSRDQLHRVSYILGVYEALRVLFPHSEETRDTWVTRPNSATLFNGRAPIEIMRENMVGLYHTFLHLAAARGW
jgi:Protein of unknown function (DUF2384)